MNTVAAPSPRKAERLIHVVQGQYRVSTERDVVMTTILGSCVATCMWDPVAEVGGMNHFLLPGDEDVNSGLVKYGVNAMELLINGLLQKGASRKQLRAKLFGGARVLRSLSDNIGAKNGAFAERFLRTEGIECVAQSLGGDRARRIRFSPTTGRAGQLLLDANAAEPAVVERPAPAAPGEAPGSIELF